MRARLSRLALAFDSDASEQLMRSSRQETMAERLMACVAAFPRGDGSRIADASRNESEAASVFPRLAPDTNLSAMSTERVFLGGVQREVACPGR